MTTSPTAEYLSMSTMDRVIVNNREPPDRGRVEAKWIVCHMLWQYRESNVIYEMFCKRKISDYANQTMYIYYGLPAKTYFIDSVPIYGIDCERNSYVLSCMYGAEETLDLKYHKLEQFARKLSASLARPGEQHQGIFAVCDNSNGCCRVFDIKYHPPQRMYCLREYGLGSTNEVGCFITAATSFQKSVLNIFAITKTICMRHVSTTPDDGQLCEAGTLPDGDKAMCTTVMESCRLISNVIDDDDDVDLSHLGTYAECPPAITEQPVVQPEDNSDERTRLAPGSCHISPNIKRVRKKVVNVKDIITTMGYEGLHHFIPRDSREPTPFEMLRCETSWKENNRFNPIMKPFLEHWFDRHQPGGSKKSGKFKIGCVVYSLEHMFPYIFAVLIFNIMAKYGKCTEELTMYVRELLNCGPNLDVITEKENLANGKVSDNFIKKYVKKKCGIWKESFHFENQESLHKFLYEVKLLFEQNMEPKDKQYFKQSWAELIPNGSRPPQSLAQPEEFVDFVRIGNGIFG